VTFTEPALVLKVYRIPDRSLGALRWSYRWTRLAEDPVRFLIRESESVRGVPSIISDAMAELALELEEPQPRAVRRRGAA